MTCFCKSLPYRFYPIYAILLVAIIAWTGKDFGSIRACEELAMQRSESNSEEADDRFARCPGVVGNRIDQFDQYRGDFVCVVSNGKCRFASAWIALQSMVATRIPTRRDLGAGSWEAGCIDNIVLLQRTLIERIASRCVGG
ncbi:MAG: hypothetical protein R3C05_24865 [Pirellulaceae bacterium]